MLKILTSNVFYDFSPFPPILLIFICCFEAPIKSTHHKRSRSVYYFESNFPIFIELIFRKHWNIFCVFIFFSSSFVTLNLHWMIPRVRQTAMFLLESWMQHNICESINKHFNLTNMHLRINFFVVVIVVVRLMLLREYDTRLFSERVQYYWRTRRYIIDLIEPHLILKWNEAKRKKK